MELKSRPAYDLLDIGRPTKLTDMRASLLREEALILSGFQEVLKYFNQQTPRAKCSIRQKTD